MFGNMIGINYAQIFKEVLADSEYNIEIKE